MTRARLGTGPMKVVVREVGMGQSRQALLYRKESEFYSQYNGMSWKYKARVMIFVTILAAQLLTLLLTWNSLFSVTLVRECAQLHPMEDRGQVHILCPQQPRHR